MTDETPVTPGGDASVPPDATDAGVLRAELDASAEDVLMLSRCWPPRGRPEATSYFGGLPTLPARLDWPTRGDGQQMPFVAQIDLGRLPDFPQRGLLPAHGALYFFWSAADGEPLNGAWPNVLYAEEDPATLPVRPAPQGLTAPYDQLSDYVFNFLDDHGRDGRRDTETGLEDMPRLFPRWEMRFDVVRRHADQLPESFDQDARDRYETLYKDIQRPIYEAAFGPLRRWRIPEAVAVVPPKDLPADYPFPPGTYHTLWLPDDAWPYSWLHVHACAARLLKDLGRGSLAAGRWDAKRFPEGMAAAAIGRMQARIATALDRALDWKREAANGGHVTAVPADRRAAFRSWLAETAQSELYPDPDWARIDPTGRDAPAGSPEREAFRLRNAEAFALRQRASGATDPLHASRVSRAVEHAVRAATDACIAYAPDPAALLPAPVIAYWRLRNAPLDFTGEEAVRHQLFGTPTRIQHAPEDYGATHVLLAQFDSDPGIFFEWGDVGMLQYWLPRDDIGTGRFDRVAVTLEGH